MDTSTRSSLIFNLLITATLVPAFLAVSSARTQSADLDVTSRRAVAAEIHSLVQQYFAHWATVPRSEVEAAYRKYLDEAVRAETRKDFDLATLRFIAKLRNGHTQFSDSQGDGRPLKFRLLEVESQWAVVFTQDSHVPRGAVVRTINGKPVKEFVRESAASVAASNDALHRLTCSLLQCCFLKESRSGCRMANLSSSTVPSLRMCAWCRRSREPKAAGCLRVNSPTFGFLRSGIPTMSVRR